MPDSVIVTKDIQAPPETVFALVSELSRMGEWSSEATGGKWIGNASGPQIGAKFEGTNKNGSKKWKTISTVTAFESPRLFSFRVAAPVKVADWTYQVDPTPTGCTVTETWTDLRNPFIKLLGKSFSGVSDRVAHNRASMIHTLDQVAKTAEAQPHQQNP
jgi:uncharacterized protein YndB with AHSA1/START domain